MNLNTLHDKPFEKEKLPRSTSDTWVAHGVEFSKSMEVSFQGMIDSQTQTQPDTVFLLVISKGVCFQEVAESMDPAANVV
jgi:hypothetical protein